MRRTNQKFQPYDLVQLRDDIPWIWRGGKDGPTVVSYHDYSGMKGVVHSSYDDQFGGGKHNRTIYTVVFKGKGPVSWVDEADMTLIEEGRADLYQKWRK